MSNVYTQLLIHLVISVGNSRCRIQSSWEADLYKQITEQVSKHQHKLIIVNGMPDHIHMLIQIDTRQSVVDLVHILKRESARWINRNKLVKIKFAWADGFGAFSHSRNQMQRMVSYIQRQKFHHENLTFSEEYKRLLTKFGIQYDDGYLFDDL